VGVHVNQARKQRGFRQIDRGIAGGRFHFAGGGNLGNPFVFDNDSLIGA